MKCVAPNQFSKIESTYRECKQAVPNLIGMAQMTGKSSLKKEHTPVLNSFIISTLLAQLIFLKLLLFTLIDDDQDLSLWSTPVWKGGARKWNLPVGF